MSLTIYEFAHSPFCVPITQALRAWKVPFETVDVPNHDRRRVIELTGGAYYQVPVLDHDGRLVFESGTDTQDVAEYIDRTFCGAALFPARWAGWQRLLIPHLEDRVEAVGFRICDAHYIPAMEDVVARTMIVRHKERKFGRGCVDQWRRDEAALRQEATLLLTPFDEMLEHTPFLTGDRPIYSDFLLYGVLANMTWLGRIGFPPLATLKAWHGRLREWRAN